MKQGLQRFVLDTLTPLNRAIGDAWMRGELEVFEEHLYTEQLQVALRTAINAFPRQTGTPRVLLTTFPGEHHGVGLLMVEALLVPEGGAVHFARRADAARGHPARGARAQGASRRVVVFGRVSGAAGQRGPGGAAPAAAADGHALGRRRDDAPRPQDAAGRRADPGPAGGHRRIEELACALGPTAAQGLGAAA